MALGWLAAWHRGSKALPAAYILVYSLDLQRWGKRHALRAAALVQNFECSTLGKLSLGIHCSYLSKRSLWGAAGEDLAHRVARGKNQMTE